MAFAASAAALVLALAPAGPAAAAAVKADFGDAPDGRGAGYATAPAVVGHFPSRAATPGPRHAPFGDLFLGADVSGEADSAQVDKDRFDDGVETRLSRCGSSTLRVVLNGAALPASTRTAGHTAYVNAWFDWNRDGDWTDGSDGCSPEWAIQNLPVSMDKLNPGGIAVLPIGFTAGRQARDVWERVTLTLDRTVSDPGGGGSASSYAQGETEDNLIPPGRVKPILKEEERREEEKEEEEQEEKKKKRGKFKVACAPSPVLIPHGGVAKVKFVILDRGKGWIFGAFRGPAKGPGGKASVTPLKPQPPGVPPGWVAVDGFKFKSSKVDPPLRVEKVVVKFVFRRGNQTQKLDCVVLILHFPKLHNLFLPRVVCEGACRGLPPPGPPVPSTGTSTGGTVKTLNGGGTLQQPPLTTQSFFDVFFELDVDAFKIVLPGENRVMNPVTPPGAPYSCEPATKATEHDTLLCLGNLPANVHATGSFQSSNPIAPDSAQLYGRQPGSETFEGPFPISGPAPAL